MSETSTYDRVADIVRAYTTAERLARELAEQQLDSLGFHRITIKTTPEQEAFKTRLIQLSGVPHLTAAEHKARYAGPEVSK